MSNFRLIPVVSRRILIVSLHTTEILSGIQLLQPRMSIKGKEKAAPNDPSPEEKEVTESGSKAKSTKLQLKDLTFSSKFGKNTDTSFSKLLAKEEGVRVGTARSQMLSESRAEYRPP